MFFWKGKKMYLIPPTQIGKIGKMGIANQHFSIIAMFPTLWLDSTDESSIVETEGKVNQWYDKSGNGNHAFQNSVICQPTTRQNTINNRNSLHFNGTSNFMFLPDVTARTAFFVTNKANGSAYSPNICPLVSSALSGSDNQYIFLRTNQTDYTMSVDGVGRFANDCGTLYVDSGDSGTGTNIDLGITITEKTTERIWCIVGDQDYNNLSRLGSIYSLGSTGVAEIDFGEVIFFTRILTCFEINKIGRYLSKKWGIAWLDVTSSS